MPKTLAFAFALLLTGISLSSCDDDTVTIVITEERAAEIVATSLAYNTYGLASNVNYVSNQVSNLLNCNEQASNGGINTYVSNFGGVTSSYQFNEIYSKACSPEESINYSITAFQDIDAVFFSSQQDVSAVFAVSGLEDTSTNEIYNGSYHRDGNWYSKTFHDSLDVVYNMNFDELRINKSTYRIVSGVSNFDLTIGYSETTDTILFHGTVTFIHESEAQIHFNDGNTYVLNLDTGAIQTL